MKPIKIADSNKLAIEQLLQEVNGKSTAHVFDDYSEINNLAIDADRKLGLLLSNKRDHKGARLAATSGSKMPNAYKYSRQATKIIIERRSSDWWLILAASVKIYPNQSGKEILTLTPYQNAKAIDKLQTQYNVL